MPFIKIPYLFFSTLNLNLMNSDDFSLGLHLLHEHGLEDPKCFNDTYETRILEVCSPSLLEKREHP